MKYVLSTSWNGGTIERILVVWVWWYDSHSDTLSTWLRSWGMLIMIIDWVYVSMRWILWGSMGIEWRSGGEEFLNEDGY